MISKGAIEWDWGLWSVCEGGHRDLVNLMISKGATERCQIKYKIPKDYNNIKDIHKVITKYLCSDIIDLVYKYLIEFDYDFKSDQILLLI